ncbi:uncharacterized protein LOC128739611 [Sabethes cyaneus]|uniref:uncharacterized protein LOC128739611 n=1 Tax=Sabethes cyaneus TaxID=53552 RepID=UPI00237E3FC4|nr:uncharacterized protein LOC128739611 [Sabethes cyaneus]
MNVLSIDLIRDPFTSALFAFLNHFILTYLSDYYGICIIRTEIDNVYINVSIPTTVIVVDENFKDTMFLAVENGCQSFVVFESALISFLDVFVEVHDLADQRSASKKLIAVMDSFNISTMEEMKDHPNIKEIPDTTFVSLREMDSSIQLYTIGLSNNGTRGTVDVTIRPFTVISQLPDPINNMGGMPIRLCMLMYPPFIYYKEDDPKEANARYNPKYKQEDTPLFLDGTEVTLLFEFCSRHNCTIEATIDEVSFWGEVFDNHTGTGLLGAVVERRADISMAAVYYWRQPYKYATYTLPISRSGITVLVPKPRALEPWRTPFLSFSGYLWIAVAVAFCVGALAVWLIEKVRFQILSPPEMPITISDAMLTMIGFYMEQNARMRTDIASCVFLFTSLLFAGFMVGNSYGCGLAGVMTLAQYEKPIDTTRDLAASGMLFAGGALSWIYSMLKSPQPHIQTLVKNFRIRNDDYLSQHTKTHDLGFICEYTEFSHFVPSYFLDNEASTMLQLLKDDLYWEAATALVTKTCPFRQALNDLIMQVKQSGIQHYWELRTANRYLHTTAQRNIWNARSFGSGDEVVKLTISHYLGAYMILGAGLGLATLAFAIEHLRTQSDVADSPATYLISYLVLTYLSEYYCICVIKTNEDLIKFEVDFPSIIINADANFNRSFQHGVDNGCQSFVVYENALWYFLNAFIVVHDDSDQRSARKKLIIVTTFLDSETVNKLSEHQAIRELPDLLLVVVNKHNLQPEEFYTTEIFSNGSRGSVIVELRPIDPPEYFPDKSFNMKGIPIRFRTVMYPPFSYYEESTPEKSNARYDPQFNDTDDTPLFVDGTEPRLLVEFCRRHNCTIETYFDEVEAWGEVYANHTGIGILGAVATRKADFAVSAIYYWLEPYRFASYTAAISRSGVTALVPKPRTLPPWRTPFLSFSKNLWMAVAITFIVAVLAVWLMDKGRRRTFDIPEQEAITLSDSVLTMIGFYMEQNAYLRNDVMSSVILFTSLLFTGFMIGNLYGAGLAGIMTIPQYEHAIDTTFDLASSGMLWGGTCLNWMFAVMNAPEPHVKTLVSNYRVVDMDYLIQHRNTRDFGYVGERTEFGHFAPIDYLDAESSKMTRLLKDDLFWQSCTAAVTKTSPFKQSFDTMLMNIRQSGIQHFWEIQVVNNYLNSTHEQRILNGRQSASDSDVTVLTPSHLMGAFLILATGLTGGALLFFAECLYIKFSTQQLTKVQYF